MLDYTNTVHLRPFPRLALGALAMLAVSSVCLKAFDARSRSVFVEARLTIGSSLWVLASQRAGIRISRIGPWPVKECLTLRSSRGFNGFPGKRRLSLLYDSRVDDSSFGRVDMGHRRCCFRRDGTPPTLDESDDWLDPANSLTGVVAYRSLTVSTRPIWATLLGGYLVVLYAVRTPIRRRVTLIRAATR